MTDRIATAYAALLALLRSAQPGPLPSPAPIEALLSECWHTFEGAADGGMEGQKLVGRMEDVAWQPPLLTFWIERHSDLVVGSTRAELQYWILDVETRRANLLHQTHRQVTPMAPRLDVNSIADELAGLIVDRADAPCLKWNPDGSVRVLVGKVIPAAGVMKQNLEGRRKRFRLGLAERLSMHGWRERRANVYVGPDVSHNPQGGEL